MQYYEKENQYGKNLFIKFYCPIQKKRKNIGEDVEQISVYNENGIYYIDSVPIVQEFINNIEGIIQKYYSNEYIISNKKKKKIKVYISKTNYNTLNEIRTNHTFTGRIELQNVWKKYNKIGYNLRLLS